MKRAILNSIVLGVLMAASAGTAKLITPTHFLADKRPAADRLFAFTTRGSRSFATIAWQPGDWLVFGSETAGLPAEVREAVDADQRVRLPLVPGQRSLNLSNAVAVAVFEAWRQNGFAGGA